MRNAVSCPDCAGVALRVRIGPESDQYRCGECNLAFELDWSETPKSIEVRSKALAFRSTCPTCGPRQSFYPSVSGEAGPLYYFLAQCAKCGELLQRCTRCQALNPREYGWAVCHFCKQGYHIPTEEQERQRWATQGRSFLCFQANPDQGASDPRLD